MLKANAEKTAWISEELNSNEKALSLNLSLCFYSINYTFGKPSIE